MIKAIVVDDEKGAREALVKMIQRNFEDVEVVAKVDSVGAAYEAINALQPDLVFLDIEMPNGNAFDLLEKMKEINFDIIFTTAYDNYAIKAIKFSAIDYLLKPIDPEDLIDAINRFRNKTKQKNQFEDKIKALLENLNPTNKKRRYGVPEGDGVIFIDLEEVISIESVNHYSVFKLKSKKELMSTKSLNDYEILFADDEMLRVHRSYIVNIRCIRKYHKGDDAYLVMDDDSNIPVSRTGRVVLNEKFL